MVSRLRKYRGITIIEVVIIVFVVLIVIAGMVGASRKIKAKHIEAVCIKNLETLSLAGGSYAESNDGCLPTSNTYSKAGWIDCNDISPTSYENQIKAIEQGSLFEYAGADPDVYWCRDVEKETALTYSMPVSFSWDNLKIPKKLLGIKNNEETRKFVFKKVDNVSSSDKQMMFLDIGKPSRNAWGVYYNVSSWYDVPPIRHRFGTNVSFVDGHAEEWEWANEETYQYIIIRDIAKEIGRKANKKPFEQPENEDIRKASKAVWGNTGF